MVDLRTAKGTIDYDPNETILLNHILEKSVSIYKKHGATSIDTPTFELSEILKNKYGDDSKLIFDLKDQGGDICSLRYDLTVSFARYLAQKKIQKIKRYQYGKVFRRDQPAITKGRFREFVQCDFDIAGKYESMTVDAEILKIASECMEILVPGSKYRILLNHRKIHSAVFEIAGIENKIHNTICSTIDKKNKISREEMVLELKTKGLNSEQISVVEKYINYQGYGLDFLNGLIKDEIYKKECGKNAVDDLILLYKYCGYFKCQDNIVFDFSLARGTDYYTGIIFECVYDNFDVGAVIGGGRYDDLVKNFIMEKSVTEIKDEKLQKVSKYKLKKMEKNMKKEEKISENIDVPCIGFSVGVMRFYSILKEKLTLKLNETKVFVGSSGGIFLEERMKVLSELWDANISAETFYGNMNFRKQASMCIKNQIPFIVIIGEDEIKNSYVMITRGDKEGEKEKVDRTLFISKLKKLIISNN